MKRLKDKGTNWHISRVSGQPVGAPECTYADVVLKDNILYFSLIIEATNSQLLTDYVRIYFDELEGNYEDMNIELDYVDKPHSICAARLLKGQNKLPMNYPVYFENNHLVIEIKNTGYVLEIEGSIALPDYLKKRYFGALVLASAENKYFSRLVKKGQVLNSYYKDDVENPNYTFYGYDNLFKLDVGDRIEFFSTDGSDLADNYDMDVIVITENRAISFQDSIEHDEETGIYFFVVDETTTGLYEEVKAVLL